MKQENYYDFQDLCTRYVVRTVLYPGQLERVTFTTKALRIIKENLGDPDMSDEEVGYEVFQHCGSDLELINRLICKLTRTHATYPEEITCS